MTAPVFLVLNPAGLALARRLQPCLGGSRVHGQAGRVEGADASFIAAADHGRALFRQGVPIVAVCAAGILVRALAPVLADKASEPPVVALAEDGSAVVPLLGGHRGANALARTLAAALGVAPAITTAGDRRFGIALDVPPDGWTLANPADAKPFMAALVAGATVRLAGAAGWLAAADLPWQDEAKLTLRVTEQAEAGSDRTLVYHPRTLAVGVGSARGAEPAEVIALVRATLGAAGLAPQAVAVVCSIDLKADEPALHAAAADLGVPARFLAPATLEAETPRLATPSDAVFRAVGSHGVAEAAALAAAGPEGCLVVPKRISPQATCAVARAPRPLDPARIGRPRGRLAVVGIGPGAAAWRTPEAAAWLASASDIVGYHRYLDLLGELTPEQRRHGYELGAEEERARTALDLAAAGRTVVLVSSGDAGIYAMATLALELLEREERADWRRVELAVVPGISALQAAAARAGAPLGHDFCAISLSDLLTPWDVIERRIRAAAAADFVIAVFNPVSRRRTRPLAAFQAILLEHRPAATPVVVARNLGREGEAVTVTGLGDLDPATVDMLTILLVGSSATRAFRRSDGGSWVYTPRGYEAKRAPGAAALLPADPP